MIVAAIVTAPRPYEPDIRSDAIYSYDVDSLDPTDPKVAPYTAKEEEIEPARTDALPNCASYTRPPSEHCCQYRCTFCHRVVRSRVSIHRFEVRCTARA